MPAVVLEGFLEDDFLVDDFGSGVMGELAGCQVQMVVNQSAAQGAQVAQIIDASTQAAGLQIEQVINANQAMPMQVEKVIKDFLRQMGTQVQLQVQDELKTMGIQLATSNILYKLCQGFLEDGFLTGPFLTPTMCAHAGAQVHMNVIDFPAPQGVQVEMNIEQQPDLGIQVEMVVHTIEALGMEVLQVSAEAMGCQVRFVLYNTNRPRILVDFPSRGVDGLNWTANSTATGDFSVNNLNNDIVEYYWRSQDSVVSGIILTCDTQVGSGVAVDTVAILEHNLSRAATVVMQGSNSSTFASVGLEVTLPAMTRNTFWVSPSLPLEQFRYWRFLISDNTNPDDFIRIGTIIFGSAVIFQGECADQVVRVGRTHYKVENPTEGHTSVDQDLALKKRVVINFPKLDAQSAGNYDALNDIFEFARTSLKCLWMVDPRPIYIEKFSVFGKVVSLPEETHNVITSDEFRVDLTVEVDEAK